MTEVGFEMKEDLCETFRGSGASYYLFQKVKG
jgi:hypothetical protein